MKTAAKRAEGYCRFSVREEDLGHKITGVLSTLNSAGCPAPHLPDLLIKC
jgi:hypothetical protein